jgi:2-amino-4-hydroxy-6-hydroxymethyldihydropteridine diphosphokinase
MFQRQGSVVVALENQLYQNSFDMSETNHTAYIGLGANLEDPKKTIRAAITALGVLPSTNLTKNSSLYITAPIGADGDDYVNAVIELQTRLTPFELLNELQSVERQFGRVRSYRNAPRTLDCDLLLYDQQIINTPTLQVPHPRMHQRAFVLLPLTEIALKIVIPNLGLAQLLLRNLSSQPIQKILT